MSKHHASSNLFTKSLAGAAAVALSGALSVAHAEQLRGWNIHPPEYPNSVALERFANLVDERTEGEVTVKVYHGGVLGSQTDAIEQVRLGAIDFGEFNLGPMGQAIPTTNVVALPFLFKDIEYMYRMMDGEAGALIGEGMQEKGIVPLGWYDAGARSFYNTSRPINTPEDVAGMKMRVMNNDMFVNMVESLDGNATPMSFAEVFQSLKTGVVDGAENNPPTYESTNHYEVAPYLSLTEHLIIPECLCMSKRTWDGLSEEHQAIVLEAGRESALYQRELWAERQKESLENVAAGGVAVNEVADKASFQEAMQPVYDQFIEEHPDLEPIVDLVLNAE